MTPKFRKPRGVWWMPWWALKLAERLGYCWADLVFWKSFGTGSRLKRRTECPIIHEADGVSCLTCYCGFWDHERCPANEGFHAAERSTPSLSCPPST